MADLVEPCSPQHSDTRVSAEVAAVERLVPVLQDVMNKELKDLRDLKPLHDSLANRLDGASQENAAQFETLREIVKRLSNSLRDKAEIAEVTALVEQHCGDRIDALEMSCNKLVARISKCEQQCLAQEQCCEPNTEAKDADTAGGVASDLKQTKIETNGADFDELMCSSTSPVKRYSIDTVRGDPPRKDDSKQSLHPFKSELDLMRYECELERLRCMVIEGQSAMEQLRTALAREHETGVAERARLDGLQKSLADNVVTLSRTHGSVGERLQHIQQTIDDLTNGKLEKHNSSTEDILGNATTQGLEALRHHHSCLEALRYRLEKVESSLNERQDSMENMVSEENRRIWLAMERSLDIARIAEATAGSSAQLSDSGRQQQVGNVGSTTAVAAPPQSPAIVPVTSISSSTCSSPPVPVRNIGTSAKLVPCSRTSTPTQSPGHHGASSPPLPLQPAPRLSVSLPQPHGASPWHGTSVQAPPPLPPAIRSPAHGGGCGSCAPSQILGVAAEVAHTPTRGGSGALTPVRCSSPPPTVTPMHGAATPRRSGSQPRFDPCRTPPAVRAGSPTPETPMTASPLPTGSRSPSRKHMGTPGRPPPASVMVPPGPPNHRSTMGSPAIAQRHIANRSRGGTPNNTAALHRRGCQQEHVSRLPNELGAASRVRGQ